MAWCLIRVLSEIRVGLYDHLAFRDHDAGAGHPERPERLDAVRRGIREAGLEPRLRMMTPRPATTEEVRAVHTAAHIERVESTNGRTYRFDPDTQAGPHSYAAALLAAGSVVDAVDRVLVGEIDRAFCAVRPPGHHAEADRAMGFCLFNNVAVGAARALAAGLRRVAVVDFDVHHGNGTQHIFEDDPRVLYLSTHAYPFYPGSGGLDEVGLGKGKGFTVNLPLPATMGDPEYGRIYREIVTPVVRSFDPELVLVSAGFDPHRDDPLAGMAVTECGFGRIAASCLAGASGAAKGRAIFVLEGGYDLEGMAASTAQVMRVLVGETVETGGDSAPRIDSLIGVFRKHHGQYWSSLAR
jgi:acetoin utilization deacetylase AcuC-like enzyme